MASFADHLRGVRDDVVARRDEQVFANGFETAANICVAALQAKAEPFNRQLREEQLEPVEQRLLGVLRELKDEMEDLLRRHWTEQEGAVTTG
jgi:hypothetical protein